MSTLPIGSVTLKDILDKFGQGFHWVINEHLSVTHVKPDYDLSGYLYIRNSADNWALCLEVKDDGTKILHQDTLNLQDIKEYLPFFNHSDYESIMEDYLETIYALLHLTIVNPLHNTRGQVRRKTLELINESIRKTTTPKQSLAVWYTIVRNYGLHGSHLPYLYRGAHNNQFPIFNIGSSYQLVNGSFSILHDYVLLNLGYTKSPQGEWSKGEPSSTIPQKFLRVMNYSTRVPNELGFKTVEDKKGKFDSKFKKYYQDYVAAINSNSTSEYNPLAPVYLGLELEYEVDDDYDRDEVVADIVMPLLYPHGVCKSDGSLEHGIELVTVPAVYEEHVKALSPLFTNFPTELSAEETCGLHIHISRAPFNLPTQGRMIAFMNNSYNKEFLQNVGGREFNTYAHQDSSRSVSSILRGGGARYNVLNLNNSATLEFRLFQGTTDFTKIKRSMQFCLALAEYCKNLTMNIKEFTKHDNFTKWLPTQRKVYPELTDFLIPRKSIPQEYRKNVNQNV